MSNLKRYKSKFKTKIDYNPIEFDFELMTFKLTIINFWASSSKSESLIIFCTLSQNFSAVFTLLF